jgi:replicative DNA helicase
MSEVKKHVRIPPHDLDAEQATLGSIMLNPSALNEIIDIVQAETFYSEKHRIIFKAMIDLFSKNEPIDLLSLSTSLKNRGQLEQIGGRTSNFRYCIK